jgi:hypothetical protein
VGGSLGLRRFALVQTINEMAMRALLAGACALAAGLWSYGGGNSWLFGLHGLTIGTFGLLYVPPLIHGLRSFRPVSLLFIAMALSIGAFAIAAALDCAVAQSSGGL